MHKMPKIDGNYEVGFHLESNTSDLHEVQTVFQSIFEKYGQRLTFAPGDIVSTETGGGGDLMLISKGAVEGVIYIYVYIFIVCIYVCIHIYSVCVCVWWFDAHFEGSGGGGNICIYI